MWWGAVDDGLRRREEDYNDGDDDADYTSESLERRKSAKLFAKFCSKRKTDKNEEIFLEKCFSPNEMENLQIKSINSEGIEDFYLLFPRLFSNFSLHPSIHTALTLRLMQFLYIYF